MFWTKVKIATVTTLVSIALASGTAATAEAISAPEKSPKAEVENLQRAAWKLNPAKKAKLIDVNAKSKVSLPFQGKDIKQVSGLKVEVDEKGAFTAPDQICTLIFEKHTKRVVVRVWENKSHRYFVSLKGNDANPGTEDKPFQSIRHGVKAVLKEDPKGALYIGGGDYHVGNKTLIIPAGISVYGGFDEKGWRRDPIITEPLLLAHGFRKNWVNDMSDRFKDLRRPDHRHFETRIWRDQFPDRKNRRSWGSSTLTTGGRKKTNDDFYLDGLTVYGCRQAENVWEPVTMGVSDGCAGVIIRNTMIVPFYSNGHASTVWTHVGYWTNNLLWGGIFGRRGNCRNYPIIRSEHAHWHRNLIVAPVGSNYCRLICLYAGGGRFTENQIHDGKSFGAIRSRMFTIHGYSGRYPHRTSVFIGNLFYGQSVTFGVYTGGLVFENNTCYLSLSGFGRKGGANMYVLNKLSIKDNVFHLGPSVSRETFIPKEGEGLFLGGRFSGRGKKYVPPEKKGAVKAVIENNQFIAMEKWEERQWNLVNVSKLGTMIKRNGRNNSPEDLPLEHFAIRPKDPAKHLKAELKGHRTVKLTWEASRDQDVTGYIIRYGPQANSYLNPVFVKNVTSAEITIPKPGKYYFTVSAHKAAFVECWTLSNEAIVEPASRSAARPASSAEPKPSGPTPEQIETARRVAAVLRNAVIEGIGQGSKATVFIEFSGRLMRGQVVAADKARVTVLAQGLEVPILWETLSPRRFYGIARKYTDDHGALAAYCRGRGLAAKADEEERRR